MSRLLRPATTAFALATGAFLNHANASQQQCHQASIPLATTNWSSSLSVPKFDPALGILTQVQFTLDGHIQGEAKFESQDAAASTVTMTFQSTLTLTRPDNSLLVVVIPQSVFVDPVASFDGVIDFGGTSGMTHANITASQSAMFTSPRPLSDLALFTGPSGNPGSIVLPVVAQGTSNASGAGNLLLQFSQQARADVTVCYVYEADCNLNGIPDVADIQGGMPDADQNGVPDQCEPQIIRFCFGDGDTNDGPACPCGNSTPNNLDGCLNVTGLGGSLVGNGVPSVSNDTLQLVASQLPPGVPGFFFQGTSKVLSSHGGDGLPFGDGLKCVGGTVVRMAKIVAAPQPGGSVVLPFAGDPPISQQFNILPGDTRFYQVWYRSGIIGPCGFPFNTTNGVHVVWGL